MNDNVIKLPNGDFTTSSHLKNYVYQTRHLGKPKGVRINKFMLIEDRIHEVHSVIVHRFKMGDVEDPDLYAAQPLYEWQQSEMGKFVMEKSVETPMWHRNQNPASYHTDYAVQAWLRGSDYSFWVLKWGNEVDREGTIRI